MVELVCSPIRRTDLAEEVYRVLRDRISGGELQVSAKVRPESIAKELGVSRTPVVEAINRLAHEGLVVLQPNRGTYVSDLSTQRVLDLFDARLMIEEFAAERALARVNSKHLKRLERLLASEEQLIHGDRVGDFLTWHRINREFHQCCVDIAGNVVLSELYASLNIDIVMARAYQLVLLRLPREVHGEHGAILHAYVVGDLNALRDGIRAHLTRGKTVSGELAERRGSI